MFQCTVSQLRSETTNTSGAFPGWKETTGFESVATGKALMVEL